MDVELAQLLWDEIPDAVVALSPEGCVLSWNRAAEDLFGYTRNEALGRVLRELIVPIGLLEEQGSFLEQTLTGGTAVYESVRRHKNGSLLYVNVSAKAVTSVSGNLPRCIVATKKDITQLKVERERRLLESKFRDVLEATPDAIVIVNITGHIVLMNSHAEEVFGYGPLEAIGKSVAVLLPEQPDAQPGALWGVPGGHIAGARLDLFGLRSDGAKFPAEITSSPLVTEEGTVVISAVRNLSDRKKAERKFRDLLEAAPDAMVIVGRDGRIALINSQTERLFGYSRQELLGLPVETLVPHRFRGSHTRHRGEFFADPRTRAMGAGLELFGLRRDGSEFPVEVSLSPLETEDGLFVSSAIRDATERRRIQETLQEASRTKSEFLANMSHELRTPLNGIIGFSEFLIDGKPGPLNWKQQEYLTDILNSGRHLLQLVNDVLDLSKVEAGRMEVHPEEFDLLQAVDEACAVVAPMATQRNIAIRREIEVPLRSVTLDRAKLSQVLHNLLSNAVKFSHADGETAVLIDCPQPRQLRIRVRDRGIGIQHQDFAQLFVQFKQLDSGATRRYPGTGLGLALTKKLVELQGGSIAVESEPGQGSIFTVILPLNASEVAVS